jgi:hypothetical protein
MCRSMLFVGVEKGLANVCDFYLDSGSPSSHDLAQVRLSLKRMKKYGSRGYYFKKYPKLIMIRYGHSRVMRPRKHVRSRK